MGLSPKRWSISCAASEAELLEDVEASLRMMRDIMVACTVSHHGTMGPASCKILHGFTSKIQGRSGVVRLLHIAERGRDQYS